MNKNNWIKGAVVLGFSFFIAILLVKPIGVSTQFSVLSGIVHSTVDSDVIVEDSSRETGYRSSNAYYDKSEGKLAKAIKNPLNYDFIFVLSIPVGGYLGYLLFRRKKKAEEEEDDDEEELCSLDDNKKGFIRKYALSFIGGFLLLFGARMADGCTSGHMMSGMMQGSISGYVFAISVFATAIPTAIIVKKIKKAN
ncbi:MULTISPECIES: YeeE/YedE thiosulfate transporter family protein [Clostridium]|uniref:YeeE/YedE thiosulfate transporter family protein n=1 Tax=Clostridium TaxID=1485 RepID=UPI00189F2ED1|nr:MULTISPECIES: YeeE/YedE thiosulfate transporter family protein [Clostridium]MDB2107223.1 YeeE/YedE thiosulfate transporter family protein [Clostridium paraputrificum]MDB2113780.1 YeeE/YedE thiosulfate transporter family protein [Clostridium paraputrificum]MDB2118298.1 YeeE/YedE thiosulfate transporter family protein [Clostridium paraputrificum]MDU3412114.1 YeeE/YedE thiosulfate transporter family protein [Clostridium sp.]MDU4789552.1 YeeE/YedE thiosulfate transporter family protein [Clostri